MNFKVNDKVVCVDAIRGFLGEGAVYVIREVCLHPISRKLGVRLVGVTGRTLMGGLLKDWPFRASRFRLLSEVQEENRRNKTIHNIVEALREAGIDAKEV